MKKFLTITLALLLTACAVVHASPAPECAMSLSDAHTIQGGTADVTVYYDFDTTIHALCCAVCFPIPLTVESVSVNPTLRDMDGVLLTVDADEDGQVSVGILCAQSGLTGQGELLTIRFRFAGYYAEGYESVDLIVTEAYHDELGGDAYPVCIDHARSNIYVRPATTADVMAILHRVHEPITAPAELWMDYNADGRVTAVDALLVLRKIMGLI